MGGQVVYSGDATNEDPRVALLGSILNPIIPDTTVTIEGEGLMDVVGVIIWSPTGETGEPQPIVEQTDTLIEVDVTLGDLPYCEDATLELVVDGEPDIMEPVAVEPPENVVPVDVTTPADNGLVVATLNPGDQIVQIGGNGTVNPDGTYAGTVNVKVWRAETETYEDPVIVTDMDYSVPPDNLRRRRIGSRNTIRRARTQPVHQSIYTR